MYEILTNIKTIRTGFIYLLIYFWVILAGTVINLYAQVYHPASPAIWNYPEGNAAATKYIYHKSKPQEVDSFKIKWSSSYIFGDVQPLVGNIVHNPRIIDNTEIFPYSPNEIAAVIGDNLIILDGAGRLLSNYPLVDKNRNGMGIINISALLDTNSTEFSPFNSSRTLVLGFESIESRRADSLAVAYLGGWLNQPDGNGEFGLLRRMAINLKSDYLPNVSASLKPIFAKKQDLDGSGVGYSIFVTVNMSQATENYLNIYSYYRGLAKFNLANAYIGYPLPDEGDEYFERVHVGPQVSFAQPSISNFQNGTNSLLLPCFPSPVGNNDIVDNTFPNEAYLFNYSLGEENIDEIFTYSLLDEVEVRPRIRNYFVELIDEGSGEGEKEYILMTTEYNGISGASGSRGVSGLFLYDTDGTELFDMNSYDGSEYPFFGSKNHYWSVAVGNVDGRATNEWLPCYPNNPGKEIIVTQSSRDFAYPGSKLMILRYNTGFPVPKASPPGENLRNLDTICTQKIKGWVAAVNDLDGLDGKDEIIIVGGTDLKILRMRDYSSVEFRSGNCFDTVFSHTFPNQTITSVAVSDVDGDGLNDIIVTTNEGLHVLGTPLARTISIAGLHQGDSYQIDYCFGDTLSLKWTNIIEGSASSVDIYLQLYKEGVVVSPDTLIPIVKNYSNTADTVIYNLVVDSNIAGLEGRLIVQSTINPVRNADTTGYVKFNKPNLIFDKEDVRVVYSGAEITLSGHAMCADSIELLYTFDTLSVDTSAYWQLLGATKIDPGTNIFNLVAKMPCIAGIFDCISLKTDTTIFGKLVYRRHDMVDSSDIFAIIVKPALLELNINRCEGVCPSRVITWKIQDSSTAKAKLNILISEDDGETFKLIGNTILGAEEFVWNVPTDAPDRVILRFCCDEACFRADTIIQNFAPHYIKTVAPNPLKVPFEADIVYVIKEDAKVTIRIIDQANRVVREIISDAPRNSNIAYCEKWDGRLEDKTIVANGMYYIYLEVSTGEKEIYPIFIKN